MCRRIIEHWMPCSHQRLLYIAPCQTAKGTPGLKYEDCADGEYSHIEEPSSSPCPVCQRYQRMQAYFQGLAERCSLSTSTAVPESTPVCSTGEHEWHEIDNGGMRCVICAVIRGANPSTSGSAKTANKFEPAQAFADDQASTAIKSRGSTAYQQAIIDAFEAASNKDSERTVVIDDGRIPTETATGLVENAPTPASTATSNARAETSWDMYQSNIGRRLPSS